MKSSLYVIHDRVTKQFGEIFECSGDPDVVRSFTRMFKQSRSELPVQDLVILCVANCDKSGSVPVVTPVSVPYTVLRGDEISYDEAPAFSGSAFSGDSGPEAIRDPVQEA